MRILSTSDRIENLDDHAEPPGLAAELFMPQLPPNPTRKTYAW
jgi:hypothetical protein